MIENKLPFNLIKSGPDEMQSHPHPVKALLKRPFGIQRVGGGPNTNVVFLTFDDGPTPGVTEGVLERLESHQAKAAFFLVGNKIPSNENLVRQIADQGHVVGNHSFSHPASRFPDPISYVRDVGKCQEIIRPVLGEQPELFRAPYGHAHPGSLIAPWVFRMKSTLWSLDSHDWRCQSEADAHRCAEATVENIRGGDIVLLHDFSRWSVMVLDVMLPELLNKGFDLQEGPSLCTTRRDSRLVPSSERL